MRADLHLVLGLWITACGASPQPTAAPSPRPGAATAAMADPILDVINEALRADARSERAESLYAPGVLIIADGQPRAGLPRYAGITSGGQVAVASSRIDLGRSFAWGYVEYRWFSTQENEAREGRATLVLAPAQGRPGWWIVHAHSSTVR